MGGTNSGHSGNGTTSDLSNLRSRLALIKQIENVSKLSRSKSFYVELGDCFESGK